MMKNLKAVSWQVVSLLLLALALAGVSAAPSSPARRPMAKVAAAYPRVVPPLSSVRKLREHIAFLKKWGRDHQSRVKTGYLEAYLYRLQHLAYPNDQVNWERYARGTGDRNRLPASTVGAQRRRGPVSAQALEPVPWEYVGPNSLSVPYRIFYGQGTLSGRVSDVAYDPGANGTYWVASAGGGVWKSVDSGQTWSFLSAGWPALETSCVTVHPTNGNIAYVGTGDFHGVGGYYGFGIMKTTDGGQSWTNVGSAQFGDMSVSDIVVDPENPLIVVASTGRGRGGQGKVWRSLDGGTTWSAVIPTQRNWTGLSVGALEDGNRYYWATGNGSASEVWRSADRGATWTKLGLGLGGGFYAGLGIAASRINAGTAFLVSGPDRKILKTINAGDTWTDITAGFPADFNPGDRYNWSQSWYDWHINTSTNGAQDVVYVGLIDLVVSSNGGASWQSAGGTYTVGALTHNDQHCLAVNPANPNEVLVGNDGGIFRMSYTPGTGAVVFNTSLNAGLGISQFYTSDYHPTDPTRMLGGTQDNATPAALGNLAAWQNVCGGDGCGCAINSINPNIQYASAQFQSICRTTDQWNAVEQDISPNWGADTVPFIGRLVLDPTNPYLMYAGTNYLWRWNDAGFNWTPRLGGTELAIGGSAIQAIAVAPNNSNVIYTGSGAGDVFRSPDAGATWTRINTGTPALPVRAVMAISVHPTDPNSILVGLSGTGSAHLWKCADTSQAAPAWVSVGTGLPDVPVNAVVTDPAAPGSRYYVGTDVGVFTTVNGGGSWENATAPRGLPNVMVNDLKLVPGTGFLMAATYGRGIWRLDLRAPMLTITSPNGGESLAAGTRRTVTWSSAGTPGNVKLEYSSNNGSTWSTIEASTPNDGSAPWDVPVALTSQGRVRVTSLDDGGITDVSDAPFSIINMSITVISPNGGEVWGPGSARTITWTSLNLTGTVKLEYSLNSGSSWTSITAGTTNDGSHPWTVPSSTSSQALVRASSVVEPSASDVSDATFTIPTPTITVLSPNGGELWAPGSLQTISWTSANLTSNVRLEYSLNSGASWLSITASTANDGAQNWSLPNVTASGALVRVSSATGVAVSDISDGAFTIGAASFKLGAPNGGESWVGGSVQLVTWTSVNGPGTVRLEWSPDNGATWQLIADSRPNTGSFDWTVSNVDTTQARVRVSSQENALLFDVSDAAFTIAAQSLQVTSPNGGETWLIGSAQTITWASTNVTGAVQLDYSIDDGANWSTIAASTANDGSETWLVPETPTSQARIRVLSLEAPQVSDVSDAAFTLPAPTITVTSPNGGESWEVGTMQSITWSAAQLSGNVKLELTLNGGSTWSVISLSTANDGSEPWMVSGTRSSAAMVRVTSVLLPSVSDSSNAPFGVTQAEVVVNSPNGGESWGGGSVHSITWSTVTVTGAVRLEYSVNGGSSWLLIAASTVNDGAEAWTVPLVPTTQALVRVTSVNEPWAVDQSDAAFTIPAPGISVTSPNGGEIWVSGSSHVITWSSVSVPGPVKLEYSLNGGAAWSVIAASTANDGTEPWALPAAPSSTALVRVTSVDGSAVDTSDAAFTVSYVGGILKVGTRLNFGAVKVGKTRRVSLKVTNNSRTQDLVVSLSAPAGPFAYLGAPGMVTIRPKKSQSFAFAFTPPARGPYAATLTVASSDPARPTVAVEATGKGK